MKFRGILILLFLSFSIGVQASKNDNELAVHLLSYLAQDYGAAVNDGKVKSKDEYQEQIDFINEVVRIAKDNKYEKSLNEKILTLKREILKKESAFKVSNNVNSIKSKILKRYKLLTYPVQQLNLVRAKQLFNNNCVSCHGASGFGDGKDGAGLDPVPTNFHNLKRMKNVSPYGAFNTISYGVSGTGMASHNYLSEKDRWSLAYYITSLRFEGIKKKNNLNLSLKESSSLSDNEIQKNYNIEDDKVMGVLASIRDVNHGPPSGGVQGQVDLHLSKAIKDLEKSLTLYSSRKYKDAMNISLTAYLQGIEPVEGILKSIDKSFVPFLESRLSKYRGLLSHNGKKEELKTVLITILKKIKSIKNSSIKRKTNISTLLMSFGVVLREAFEAGLILFLLLGLTKKSNATIFNKSIHFGWVSSLVAGGALYFIMANYFSITGKFAEALAGYTSLIASIMLFYVGYWMHKNTDINQLKEKLIGAVESSIGSGKGVALFLIAFTACFREIFEIILFLNLLIIDGHQGGYVALGALLAIIVTGLIIITALKYSIKINLKYLFKASTFLILSFSTIFLGKGIGALQKIGSLKVTTTELNSYPALGFNSSLEVLIAQLAMVVIMLSYFLLTYRKINLEKTRA